MKHSHIILLNLFICGVLSQTDCKDGSFKEVNGECKYYCRTDDRYISIDSLSFDFIKEADCDNIRQANKYDSSQCNSIEDLVWNNNTCECPYCKCSNTDSFNYVNYYTYYISFPEVVCLNCSCGYHDIDGINDIVYNCINLENQAVRVDLWEEYQCPPNECQETRQSGQTFNRDSFEYWWQDFLNDSDTLCQEFCYCPESGNAVCQTGWDNILDDDGLKTAFMEDCGQDSKAVE